MTTLLKKWTRHAELSEWVSAIRQLAARIHQLDFLLPESETAETDEAKPGNLIDISTHRKELPQMKTQTFKAGETIIAEGTTGSQTFLIKEGQVLICKETGRKGRIPIATLKSGEVFGEMYLLDETGFRSASVVAQCDVTVEIIPQEEMKQYLEQTPPIMLSIMKTLSARLAQTSQENSILKFKLQGPIGRLLKLLHGG